MSEIRPVHPSVLATALMRITPINMEKLCTTLEHREFLERQSASIFTDMVNSGQSFQAALAAIYLSGMENAVALMNEGAP